MRLLLDTHTLLWWVDDDPELSPEAQGSRLMTCARSTSQDLTPGFLAPRLPASQDLTPGFLQCSIYRNAAMKRHDHDPLNFALLKILDTFARENGLSITDIAARDGMIEGVRSSLEHHISHEARIHGLHIETMFAHIAAAMGEAILISEEDAGAFFCETGLLKRPDFRITTRNHGQMLVEVKNFYQKNPPTKPYRIKGNYLASLKRYATLNAIPLRFAIYWSRWNLWSLIDAKDLDESQELISISMPEAMLRNEMHLLGDQMISTLPPLSFRLYADKTKSRRIQADGRAAFVVAKACLCCNGVDIDDPEEREIAWFLILNGSWRETEQIAEVYEGLVDYVETRVSPFDPPNNDALAQPFRTLGSMSAMITAQYLRSTSDENGVTNLSPKIQPEQFGLLIPKDYRGSVLKLWRFIVLPNEIESSTNE